MARTILITGASGGLGRALAVEYAKEQDSILFLSGRNAKELNKTSELCYKYNSQIFTKILDVKDKSGSKNWIKEISASFSLDLIIANAGISAGTSLGSESEDQIMEIFTEL